VIQTDTMTEVLGRVAAFLMFRGVPAYLVGGYVRDRLLGRPTNDADIAVAADPLAVGADLATILRGAFVAMDTEHPTARVMLAGGQYLDLTWLRDGDIGANLQGRDFTVNAMAVPLRTGATGWLEALSVGGSTGLIDPFGGQEDLWSRRVRMVAPDAFRNDPLRLLRAVRFRAELGFEIDAPTLDRMRLDSALIVNPTAERVRDELSRILAASGAMENLRLLSDLGLLQRIIPEMESLKGVAQPPEHHWDAFEHSLHTVGEIEWVAEFATAEAGLMADLPDGARISGRLHSYLDEAFPGGRTRLALLKLAALLHDIAKPVTKSVGADGRIHFYGHQEQGAAIARDILRRLRFSTREVAAVETIIGAHLRPAQLAEGEPTGRAVYRSCRDTGSEGLATLLLSLADHRAARGPARIPAEWQGHLALTRRMIVAAYQTPPAQVSPSRLVTGRDLMTALSIPAGPRVGRVLEEIREAQAAGEIGTREEAIALARQVLP
jgi:poly(A) polymerase